MIYSPLCYKINFPKIYLSGDISWLLMVRLKI
ncbi:hypothetical protein [Acinetobacter phage Ab59]|nr:hypothetical protein [Acinetobacter phage Ab59]